jgi:hypothetical protein
VATLAQQVGRISFLYRQQVAICLAQISFLIANLAFQMPPKTYFFPTLEEKSLKNSPLW